MYKNKSGCVFFAKNIINTTNDAVLSQTRTFGLEKEIGFVLKNSIQSAKNVCSIKFCPENIKMTTFYAPT